METRPPEGIITHPLKLYSFPNYPDGLLRTSVRELSFFLMAIINGGEFNNVRILKESTLKMMLKEQIEEDKSQGLCWETSGFKSLWGHSGGDLFSVFRKLYYTAEE